MTSKIIKSKETEREELITNITIGAVTFLLMVALVFITILNIPKENAYAIKCSENGGNLEYLHDGDISKTCIVHYDYKIIPR
jgi:hypothetical protein